MQKEKKKLPPYVHAEPIVCNTRVNEVIAAYSGAGDLTDLQGSYTGQVKTANGGGVAKNETPTQDADDL